MSRLPLRVRLTLVFAAVMAAVLAVTGLFVYERLQATLDEQIEQTLITRAAGGEALRAGTNISDDESFVLVADDPPVLTREETARARRERVFTERESVPGLDGGPVRILGQPGRRGIVVAGASLEDRDEALAGLRRQLLIGGPIALLLASLAGYLLAGAALRPVESMRRRAQEISATVGGRRLPVPDADDEVARLARTLNDMLARIEAGFERERRFVAEASHELRTPLSLLKTELELALRRPRSLEELHAALASAAEETDRLVRLAEDLLVLARADEGELQLRSEAIDARELLGEVARRFAADGRVIEVDAPPGLTVRGDRLRLEQAVGNLVDNALRYGSGTVRLTARADDGGVTLSVADEGAGFPTAFLPHAFERFTRADVARTRGAAGLGLALVQAVARAHGGHAIAANVPSGGAVVTLTALSSGRQGLDR
jgi:two-component system, OmpR family, sensor kinase